MKCPKCEEGMLKKIKFIQGGKKAYLCDLCNSYWLEWEHIDVMTGHALEGKEQLEQGAYVYINPEDMDKEEVKGERERERYEAAHK